MRVQLTPLEALTVAECLSALPQPIVRQPGELLTDYAERCVAYQQARIAVQATNGWLHVTTVVLDLTAPLVQVMADAITNAYVHGLMEAGQIGAALNARRQLLTAAHTTV